MRRESGHTQEVEIRNRLCAGRQRGKGTSERDGGEG